MLSLFLAHSVSEIQEHTIATLPQAFEHPYVVVLFYAESKVDALLNTINSAAMQFRGFSYVKVNVSASSDPPPFPIKSLPCLVFVTRGKYMGCLNDKFEANVIKSCFARLENTMTKPYPISSAIDAIEASKNSTSSVIIYTKDESFTKRFRIIPEYDATIPLYVISNPEYAAAVGLEKLNSVLFTRPIDGKRKIFTQKDLQFEGSNQMMQNFVRPFITVAYSDDQIGNGLDGFTIAAIIDETNPLHRNEVADNFNKLYGTFKRNISYHVAYYSQLKEPLELYQIDNFTDPTYIFYYKSKGKKIPVLYSCFERSAGMLRRFIKSVIKRMPEHQEDYEKRNNIDFIGGSKYLETIRNSQTDDFILLSDFMYDNYDKVLDDFVQLEAIFKGMNDLKFHFYNPYVRPRAYIPAIEPQINRTTLRYYKSGTSPTMIDMKVNGGLVKLVKDVLHACDKTISNKDVRERIEIVFGTKKKQN
jgi:hypothetical protein